MLGEVTELNLVGRRQELHGLQDVRGVATGNREVTPLGRSPGQHDGVEAVAQLDRADVDSDVHPGLEAGALALHLRQAPVDEPLLHLELRDPVPEETANPLGPLVDRDVVAGASQLLGYGEPGRA